MRFLFTFVGGQGHFEPLVPIARAAERSGHTVAFGCAPSMLRLVEGARFGAIPLGRESSRPPQRIALRPLDRAREEREFRERFVRLAARYRAPLVIDLCSEWRPDVLVCDEADFGTAVAAERLELPFATLLVMAAGTLVRREVVGEALGELRAEHDLPLDPGLQMLGRYLVLSPFPRSYRDPAYPLPATAHSIRPASAALAGGTAPAPTPSWSIVRPGAPRVYFTLGTVFNMESGDLLARVITGLRELDINLLVTVGRDIDPDEFGPQPDHVHIARHIPQSRVLPHCDLVVSHGGSGSVMGALSKGLPSVLIPMGADQPLNAERCREIGVARVLDALEVTPEAARAAVSSVLAEPGYRQRAERIRDEIAGLPGPEHAVDLLERLVREKRPLISE